MNHTMEEATWEQEVEIREKHPQLFDDWVNVLNFEDEFVTPAPYLFEFNYAYLFNCLSFICVNLF